MSATSVPQTPPAMDSDAIQRAAAIVAEAAKDHFRRWFAYNHHATYDVACDTCITSTTAAIAAAIRTAWYVCEEEANRIAEDALRAAYAAEASRDY